MWDSFYLFWADFVRGIPYLWTIFVLMQSIFCSASCVIAVQCWREPALQVCHYQTADKTLTKKTLESKQETAGSISAEWWRCQTVILNCCQKPQYVHWNGCAWTICFSVQERRQWSIRRGFFHSIVSVSLPWLKIMRLAETFTKYRTKKK